MNRTYHNILRVILFLVVLYLFLLSIQLMGQSFKLFGTAFAEGLLTTTSNPFVALMIGILATSLMQSSSTTTSIVVGLVGSGTLSVAHAVPIIMGANVGTTVTNTLVSVGQVSRKDEFRRAFAGATVHDIFNILAVVIFFPLEMATGYLQRGAEFLQGIFGSAGGAHLPNPVKAVLKPAVRGIMDVLEVGLGIHGNLEATLILILALVLLFWMLHSIVRLMKSLMLGTIERIFHRVIARNAVIAIVMGMVMTVLVQSSSITTSLMIPLIGAGILTLRQVFPLTLGANIGTTITGILASLAVDRPEGTVIALCHLLFNLSGVILVYAIPWLRRIPLVLAEKLAERASENKWYIPFYVGTVFFLIPGLFMGIYRWLAK